MDSTQYEILSSRNITDEEFNQIITLLNKYKMNATNFINNYKTLKLNKVNRNDYILNGYDPVNNVINYNDKTDLFCELLHVASSTKNVYYQGICIKPNMVYPDTMGYGLNEGITDLFLELGTKREGYFPFEKICAKVLKYAYGVRIFNCYFFNSDGAFRHFFPGGIDNLLINLDDYTDKMIYIKNEYEAGNKRINVAKVSVKVLMTVTIDELLKVVSNSDKDCKKYLLNQLKSKTMQPIYDIIGEYNYDDYHV